MLRVFTCFTLLLWAISASAVETILAELESDIVPSPVEYALIAPDGFQDMKELPVVLNLHGGGGSRQRLVEQRG